MWLEITHKLGFSFVDFSEAVNETKHKEVKKSVAKTSRGTININDDFINMIK